jgi:hypothetical protein
VFWLFLLELTTTTTLPAGRHTTLAGYDDDDGDGTCRADTIRALTTKQTHTTRLSSPTQSGASEAVRFSFCFFVLSIRVVVAAVCCRLCVCVFLR